MKEYKLSAKSKYSVLYLLCGLFMFFFMFAILNLSSFASSITPVNYNFNSLNWNGIDVPAFRYTISGTGHFTYVGAGGSQYTAQQSFYVVTENGAINLANYKETFTSTSTVSRSVSYSGTCLGKPINFYIENNDLSAGYGVWVWDSVNLTFTPIDWSDTSSFGGGSSSQLSDYSSYSFVSSANQIEFDSSFGLPLFKTGSPVFYNFNPYSGTHYFTPTRTNIAVSRPKNKCKYLFMFSCRSAISSLSLNIRDLSDANNGGVYPIRLSDMIVNSSYNEQYFYYYFLELDEGTDTKFLLFNFDVTTSSSCNDFCFACLQYKATISDYMDYVQKNYQDINPSVIDLNQNTAQSVSDISTAQTFETSAFDNFDTQFSQSGLDTFSMSFASTPLLWVSSIITTFYNNMPSTFQYLLMFVAFVGILCTVLNVFGRVAQRFGGGDNAAKLNGKDVFSKIEKNGSI